MSNQFYMWSFSKSQLQLASLWRGKHYNVVWNRGLEYKQTMFGIQLTHISLLRKLCLTFPWLLKHYCTDYFIWTVHYNIYFDFWLELHFLTFNKWFRFVYVYNVLLYIIHRFHARSTSNFSNVKICSPTCVCIHFYF